MPNTKTRETGITLQTDDIDALHAQLPPDPPRLRTWIRWGFPVGIGMPVSESVKDPCAEVCGRQEALAENVG